MSITWQDMPGSIANDKCVHSTLGSTDQVSTFCSNVFDPNRSFEHRLNRKSVVLLNFRRRVLVTPRLSIQPFLLAEA